MITTSVQLSHRLLFPLVTVLLLAKNKLLESHVNEWESFWTQSFSVQAKGNLDLSRVFHSSLYAIVAALPSKNSSQEHDDLFYGLSPTGLGRGGAQLSDYEGLGS